MLAVTRIISLFSRSKSTRNIKKSAETFNKKELEQSLLIDGDFNYLQGLNQITLLPQQIEDQKRLQQAKNLFFQHDFNCLQVFRQLQQNYLKNINTRQELEISLSKLIHIKLATYAKFRKWQQIIVDCDNRIKLVLQTQKQTDTKNFHILTIYNQRCIANILSDHDRLHSLLMTKKSKKSQNLRRSQAQKGNAADQSSLIYSTAQQRAQMIKPEQNCYNLYIQTVKLQAIGLLILGQREKALKKLSKITGDNIVSNQKQHVILLIITALSVQNQAKETLRPQLIQKLSKNLTISENEASQMSAKCLDASTAQNIVNQLCISINNKSINQLDKDKIFYYGRFLCLIAENYYLQGKIQDCQRLLAFLKERQSVQTSLLLRFIKMGIQVDSKKYEQAISLFQQYKASQIDREKGSAGDAFYDISSVNNDLIRVNIYKLMVRIYKQIGNKDKQEDMKDEAEAMETSLLTYTLKQPVYEQDQIDKVQDWRFNTELRIPYYYFNLKINLFFEHQWKHQHYKDKDIN